MPLTMDVDQALGVPRLTLSGQLVLGDESTQYRERILQMNAQGQKRILLDLSGVERIDSCGIGILVETMVYTVKQGGRMKLVSPNRRVHNALVVHRLIQAFEIYDTADAALASFSDAASA